MFHQDKRLERIVPPRELCQKIPAGKFANSALVWQCTMFLSSEPPKKVWEVIPRSECFSSTPDAPAPTLEEIMEALVCRTNEPCVQWNGGWYVSGDRPNGDGRPEAYNPVSSVTAAMKLWLDVEGFK